MAQLQSTAESLPSDEYGGVTAPAHFALAQALQNVGQDAAALAAFAAAVASAPDHAAARIGFARALLGARRAAEAFVQADAALRLNLGDAEAWSTVAAAFEALGESDLARRACERAIALAPTRASLRLELGRICESLDRLQEAATHYNAVLAAPERFSNETAAAHLGLSRLYGQAVQLDLARKHGVAALRLDPASQGGHQNLATIADLQGRSDEAEIHRERAYRDRALIVTLAPSPLRRVLTLASAARANAPDRYLIPASRYDRLIWFLGYAALENAPADYDVVFNAVADPDAAIALQPRLEAFAAECLRPLLNAPQAVVRAARDRAHLLFSGVEGLVTPRTWRVSSSARADARSSLCENEAVIAGSPRLYREACKTDHDWLLRPIGSHGGERLQWIANAELRIDSDAAQAATHYLTAFHDFRSADGLYRKYRILFVDRQPYPYHLAIGANWLLHYQSSDTAKSSAHIAEELRFLEDPERALGTRAFRAVVEIGRRLDLDYAGVDFAVLPDGEALLFEANASMLIHPLDSTGPLAHKNSFVRRILQAFWARLETA